MTEQAAILADLPVVETEDEVEVLLAPARAIQERLRRAYASEEWLDAYLLTAGLWQIVEDRIHADPFQLRRAAAYLRPRSRVLAQMAGSVADMASPSTLRARLLAGPSARLADLATRLAMTVLLQGVPPPFEPALSPGDLDVVGDALLRLPAGFAGLDQYPGDIRELARRYLERAADPSAPVCVVGVRTSGNYYAPLCAAALRGLGGVAADVMSHRPARPLHRGERERLRDMARRGGRILIIDDPPGSGSAIAATAEAIHHAGVPRTSIVLLLSLYQEAPPDALRAWDNVSLPWSDWEVHSRLADAPAAFARLVGPTWTVQHNAPPITSARPGRGHARARFRVEMARPGTSEFVTREVLVEGAGLGLFGRQALIANRLREGLPSIFGFADGLLYTEFLPASPTAAPLPGPDSVAKYVVAREAAMPIESDPTPRMHDRQPAWQVAAHVLARPFGPLAPVSELALGRLCRGATHTSHPCLVDGDMRPDLWRAGRDGSWRKTGFFDGTYSHFDALCFDPIFDLAGAAAVADRAYQEDVRHAYTARTGRPVDPERWMLYRLAHAWRLGQAGGADRLAIGRRQSMAICDYLAEVFLDGVGRSDEGELCAIDLDGVLETDRFGFPAPTPAGAMALRALLSHGYRPILASGRSIIEVSARCAAFGLDGGLAEYGAVIYERGTGTHTDLRDPRDRALLDALRATLADDPHIAIDPAYRHIVRILGAGRGSAGSHRSVVPPGRWSNLRIIEGEAQIDVVTPAIDKANGLRALGSLLGRPDYALAVGDGVADQAMLGMARLGIAPANAAAALKRANVVVTRHGYQRGLQEACAMLIGHLPGRCEVCRAPRLTRRARAVLAVLAAPEPQPGGLAGAAARIGRALVAGFPDVEGGS